MKTMTIEGRLREILEGLIPLCGEANIEPRIHDIGDLIKEACESQRIICADAYMPKKEIAKFAQGELSKEMGAKYIRTCILEAPLVFNGTFRNALKETAENAFKLLREKGYNPIGFSQMMFEDTFIFETEEEATKAFEEFELNQDSPILCGWWYEKNEYLKQREIVEKDFWEILCLWDKDNKLEFDK